MDISSKKDKRTILMSATACLPNAGSEAGVGWNVVTNMSHFYNVVVFTRKTNKEKIENYLKGHPIDNLRFVYYDIPSFIRWIFFTKKKLFRNRALIYDFLWHLMAIPSFKRLAKKSGAVLAHHVNQCQYRILSPCYALNIPTVYGPLGGAETVSEAFYQDLEQKTVNKENKRKQGSDRKLFRWYQSLTKGKKYFLFSCNENMQRLEEYVVNGATKRLMPSVAYNEDDFAPYLRKPLDGEKPFTMIYAGTLFDWKGVKLFLKAADMSFDSHSNIEIKLIGIRDAEDQEKVKEWVRSTRIQDKIELIDFMPRNELIARLTEADLFVYPAFRDSGSMAVLEACALGCPTICFNVGGQDVFPDDMMMKVDVKETYDNNVKAFSDELRKAYDNRAYIYDMGLKIQAYVKDHFTWERKIDDLIKIYEEIIP